MLLLECLVFRLNGGAIVRVDLFPILKHKARNFPEALVNAGEALPDFREAGAIRVDLCDHALVILRAHVPGIGEIVGDVLGIVGLGDDRRLVRLRRERGLLCDLLELNLPNRDRLVIERRHGDDADKAPGGRLRHGDGRTPLVRDLILRDAGVRGESVAIRLSTLRIAEPIPRLADKDDVAFAYMRPAEILHGGGDSLS